MHLAASYKKERDWEEAIAQWQRMIASGEGGVWPYIELAKYYEHVKKDIPRALRCASGALSFSLNTAPLTGGDERQNELIRRRIGRLKRKQGNILIKEEKT